MAYLVFDIETAALPFEELDETQQEYLVRNCETDEDRTRQLELMSLNPLTARVVSIGMLLVGSIESKPVGCIYSSGNQSGPEETLSDGSKWQVMSERDMMEKWWEVIAHPRRSGGGDYDLITFNGRGFDAPFLMLRSAALRVRPSRDLMAGTKFNYPHHIDLQDELAFFGYGGSGPMRRFNFDFYCKAFGIPSPKSEGITGRDVPEFYREGRYKEIAEYCMRDVHATWELFKFWNEYLHNPGRVSASPYQMRE
jgi:hypothetical protein